MDTAKPEQLGPKFSFYRSKHDGQVHAALKFPAGYEDNHPEDYEGVEKFDAAKGDKVAQDRAEAAKAPKAAPAPAPLVPATIAPLTAPVSGDVVTPPPAPVKKAASAKKAANKKAK